MTKEYYEEHKEEIKIKQKAYREANREKLLEDGKKYREANREKLSKASNDRYYAKRDEILEKSKVYRKVNLELIKERNHNNSNRIKYNKKYYEENPGYFVEYREKNKERYRNYHKLNVEKRSAYHKKKTETDPLYRIKCSIRGLIRQSFRSKNYKKESKTVDILGCSFEEFKQHLESKFEPWMNWDNRALYNGEANYGWDLDHIIPMKTATTEEEVVKLNHFTNLQPLCSYVNRHVKRANTN